MAENFTLSAISGVSDPDSIRVALYINGRLVHAPVSSLADYKVVYSSKSGNYTAVANDNNAFIRFTATATYFLPPAATAGANWHTTIFANGGDVTIDPNGAETINGVASVVIPNGTSATVICSGSGFFCPIPGEFQFIRKVAGTGSVSSVIFADLANFKTIRCYGTVTGNASTSALAYRVSTTNGVSFDLGASDYAVQVETIQNNTQAGASSASQSSIQIGPSSGIGVRSFLDLTMTQFNQTAITQIESKIGGLDAAGAIFKTESWGQRTSATANNAFAILVTAGALTSWDLVLTGVPA